MKNNKTKIISLCILVIGIAAIAFFVSRKTEAPTTIPEIAPTPEPAAQVPPPTNDQTASSDIIITTPTNNQELSSGVVKVSGTARGNWYFEGSAPFEIDDSNKNVIETSSITAQGEWMTTDFVPFVGQITFTIPKGIKSGFVVFHNDNPSGDPTRDKFVSVPVTFK